MTRLVRVGDVLELRRRPIHVDPLAEYVSIGVRSFGKRIFHYEPMLGTQLSKLRFFEVHPGELVVSNIKAWEGAIAVSSETDRGCIASNRFLTYVSPSNEVDLRYVCHFLLSEKGLPLIQRASPGSADRNRTLAIDRFENLEIPLPDRDEQRRVVARLETLLSEAWAIRDRLASNASSRLVALYPGIVERTISRLAPGTTRLGDLADFVNDLVRPGEPTDPAKAFVGLQHVESHTGRRIGELPLGGEKGRKFLFAPGDIVYGYLRPYLNKVWVADMFGLCSVDQYVLRPRDGVSPWYLAHALRSRATLEEAMRLTHNLQLPRLRSGLLAEIEIPMVPKDRQAEVVASLDTALAKTLHACDLRKQQERRIVALEESVLNRAFAGSL